MQRSFSTAILLLILISALAIIYYTFFNDSIKTYEGVYTQGYNVTDFQPCDSNEHWWVSFSAKTGNIDSMYKSVTQNSTRKTFIRFTGKEVPKGENGHVGYYDRNFEIIKIDTMRTLLRKDCE